MDDSYVMPVKAIKSLVKKELESMYESALRTLNKWGHNDTTCNMLRAGYKYTSNQLDACSDHSELDDFIGDLYEMSLQEWIESL